jgi:hypothetical protein
MVVLLSIVVVASQHPHWVDMCENLLKTPQMKHEAKNKANNIDVVEFDLGEVQTINFRCQDIPMNSRFAKRTFTWKQNNIGV